MEHVIKCTFEHYYYDYGSNKDETFYCKEERVNKDFCLFHDETYLKDSNHPENKNNVIKKLCKKIDDGVSHNTPLFCIGYYLPDVKINETFMRPVYFINCTFHGANFSSAKFLAEANFSKATFSARANFELVKFWGEANFSKATFSAEANFSRTKFIAEANFSRTKFIAEANFSLARFLILAEANFTHATFSERADFLHTKFSNKAIFDHVTFSNKAIFEYATFSAEANFTHATFSARANFERTTFSGQANFTHATFSNKGIFSGKFEDITKFNYVIFEKPNNIIFEVEDMSKVSFINTDNTGIRFSDKISWGGEDNYMVIEEVWFEQNIKNSIDKEKLVSLGGVLSVYRNLRDNYEFRRRYDEAGKFFIREMELKRKYKQIHSQYKLNVPYKQKNRLERNLISLTGLYYHLSRYGEDLRRPTVIGIVIVFVSTLLWLSLSNPDLAPSLSSNSISNNTHNNSSHISHTTTSTNDISTGSSRSSGLERFENITLWQKAFERSLIDFIPLLPSGSDIKMGLLDYLIKIVGGAVTFGLIAIALRRRFERKYMH
jgi:uncharacterized protein YjbI with pentapeptide repeats